MALESFVTLEEEKGLAGVFGFLSPGAHRPMGIPNDASWPVVCSKHVLVPA
jgi:hypothetical protein